MSQSRSSYLGIDITDRSAKALQVGPDLTEFLGTCKIEPENGDCRKYFLFQSAQPLFRCCG